MRVVIFINSYTQHRLHNYLLYTNSLLSLGVRVFLGFADRIQVHHKRISCEGWWPQDALVPGAEIDQSESTVEYLNDFDLAWLVGYGCPANQHERFLILRILNEDVRFVNEVASLHFFHNKIHLPPLVDVRIPETVYSNDVAFLTEKFEQSGCSWVVKPAEGSFGRDVFKLNQGDSNAHVLIQHFTGNGDGSYCLMQKYVEEVEGGEKRVIVTAAEIICAYEKRIVGDASHRTNVRQGGVSRETSLTSEERNLCASVSKQFLAKGITHIGIDLAFPFLIEVNIVNPGGLINFERLTGCNKSGDVVRLMIKHFSND